MLAGTGDQLAALAQPDCLAGEPILLSIAACHLKPAYHRLLSDLCCTGADPDLLSLAAGSRKPCCCRPASAAGAGELQKTSLGSSCCKLDAGCVQAQLPSGHPAVLAPAAQVQGVLVALAKLHAAARRGAVNSEREQLLTHRSVVGGRGSLCPDTCSLSPTGETAACIWTDTRRWPGSEHLSSGVRMACQVPQDGSGRWLTPVVDAGEPATWGHAVQGWSKSGLLYGCLHSKSFKGCSVDTDGLGLQVGVRTSACNMRPCSQAALCCWLCRAGLSAVCMLQVSVYDSRERLWLPALPGAEDVPVKVYADSEHRVSFCDVDGERWGACAACAPKYNPPSVLVVFGVDQPVVSLCPVPALYAYTWLPGTTSLLLLGPPGLARLDLDTSTLEDTPLLALDWVDTLCDVNASALGLELVPGASVALLLHTRSQGAVRRYSLTSVDTAGLQELDSRGYRVPRWMQAVSCAGERGDDPSLHCSFRAVAVGLGNKQGFIVHQLDDGCPGSLLFSNADLRHVDWSSDASLLAGILHHNSVAVLDGRTGSELIRLAPDRLWTEHARLRVEGSFWPALEVLDVSWAANKLRVKCMVWQSEGALPGVLHHELGVW